jgi:hypothetical protein
MRKLVVLAALGVVCLLAVTASQATPLATVIIPDPGTAGFINLGTGDASVTYSNVTFVQQAALSNGSLFDVGINFSGYPAVLSSQEQTSGVANILIEFPNYTYTFSMNYATFFGNDVTVQLSNGATFVIPSDPLAYNAADGLGVGSSVSFNWVQLTTPDYLQINNITYETPEPGTIVMLGSGLLALGGTLRRKLNR